MKVYNHQTSSTLLPQLKDTLDSLREKRAFDPDFWIETKVTWISQYFAEHNLHTAVVAVSGGVDSALVLALVALAAKQNKGVKNVLPVLLPANVEVGASNQKDTVSKGVELATALGYEPLIIDVAPVYNGVKDCLEVFQKAEPWALGQLVAYSRTPMLYFLTSLLSEKAEPGVICGTTNRDEGAYLGYVGKASDGMVDLQLISDLHKSEVYRVAEVLEVPQSILKAVPTGDMYDARSDEEVFGASYDFVELYLLFLCLSKVDQTRIKAGWSLESKARFEQLEARIQKLHNYNRHKYLAGSPAVHLDLYQSWVPGGWPEHKTWTPGENYEQ